MGDICFYRDRLELQKGTVLHDESVNQRPGVGRLAIKHVHDRSRLAATAAYQRLHRSPDTTDHGARRTRHRETHYL